MHVNSKGYRSTRLRVIINVLSVHQPFDEMIYLHLMNAMMFLPSFPWMMWMLKQHEDECTDKA